MAAQDAGSSSAEETQEDLDFLDELEKDFRRGGSHSARRDLDDYLLDYPDSPRGRQLAARAALSRGALGEAEQHLGHVQDADPALRSRLALRLGRYEEALELAGSASLPVLPSARLEVAALDGLGRRREALRRARAVTDEVDDRTLDGVALVDLGWLYLFQRRFEVANQALVFADAELNGTRGPSYRLVNAGVVVLLGEVYDATRQSGRGGLDKTLSALNEVLDVDPGHADALVVKARVYRYGMNGRKASEALDRALSRDPGHPAALVERGQMFLESRRVAAALEIADRVLADNSRQRDGLALRAAALAVSHRQDEATAARERFVACHPESAALDFLLGRILQSHYRFAESIAPLERALAMETTDEEPLSVLGQSLAHLGREQEARVALEEHRERSPFPFPWRDNMLQVLKHLDGALDMVTSSGFRLRLPPGEKDVLGVLLTDRLERSRTDLEQRWGFAPDEEVLIEVFDVHADFSVRTVGFEGFMALGACFGNVVTLISPLCELRGQFNWPQTAVHEYAHVVTLGLSRNRMPRWLSEGVSVVEEGKANPFWTRALEREVLDARANDMVFPLERMDEAFQDGSTVMLGYYLGSLVCEVVERDFGFEGLVAMVAAYADGSSTGDVVRRVFEVEPEEIDRRVLEYIDSEVAGRAVLHPRYGQHGKEALRGRVRAGDTQALVQLAEAYHDLGQVVDRDTSLRRARERLGETPAVQRLDAAIALSEGRVSDALEGFRAWAKSDAVDADGLMSLARLALVKRERVEALDAVRRARLLFPGDTSPSGALMSLSELLDQDDEQERIEWLDVQRSIRRHDPVARGARLVLAREAELVGDVEQALGLYEEVVSFEPYDAGPRLALADLYVLQSRVEDARIQWQFVLGMRADQVSTGPPGGGPLENLGGDDLKEQQALARKHLHDTGADAP